MLFLEDKKLLNLHFTNGNQILPYIRYELMLHINSNKDSVSSSHPQKVLTKFQKIRILLKSAKKIIIKKKEILYFSSTLFNLKNNNGKYYNSLDGYFYELFPSKSLLVEDADANLSWRTNDSYESLSFINTYLIIIAQFISSIINKFNKKYNKDFEYLINKYPQIYNKENLSYLDHFISIYSFFIKHLLKRIGCKVLFCNCASYGGHYSIIMKIANDLGIKTIELQHGTIVKEHLAYNADSFIVHNLEYQKYLPSELWLFGEYWGNNTNWLYKKISVGYPLLNEYIKSNNINNPIFDFLIISQPDSQKYILEYAIELSKLYPNKSIKIRLHPMDNCEYYQQELDSIKNITISKGYNILYDDIIQSNDVIGVYSTCLYESLAFNKTPYIIDCELSRKYFSTDVGIWLKEPKDLKTVKPNKMENIDYSKYWDINDMDKIKKILEQYVEC